MGHPALERRGGFFFYLNNKEMPLLKIPKFLINAK
jgi:hypothetical protein